MLPPFGPGGIIFISADLGAQCGPHGAGTAREYHIRTCLPALPNRPVMHGTRKNTGLPWWAPENVETGKTMRPERTRRKAGSVRGA